jgi:hypothetical protein
MTKLIGFQMVFPCVFVRLYQCQDRFLLHFRQPDEATINNQTKENQMSLPSRTVWSFYRCIREDFAVTYLGISEARPLAASQTQYLEMAWREYP